jgi:hypothetical protein
MTTFTIDEQNNITAFASPEEVAASTIPCDGFGSEQELAALMTGWPAERLVAIWNSLPGVAQVKKFKSSKSAASRVWERIQGLGEPRKPKTERKAHTGARSARGASAKGKATKQATVSHPGRCIGGCSNRSSIRPTGRRVVQHSGKAPRGCSRRLARRFRPC